MEIGIGDHTIKLLELAQELDHLAKKSAGLYPPKTKTRLKIILNETQETIRDLDFALTQT